jgi:hypothetical protein
VRCAKCYIRIEAFELRIVQHRTAYHQHCFLMLVREKAAREKANEEWALTDFRSSITLLQNCDPR